MDPSNGGTCQAVRNIVPGLQNLGVESEVVCTDDANASFLGKDSFQIQQLVPPMDLGVMVRNLFLG